MTIRERVRHWLGLDEDAQELRDFEHSARRAHLQLIEKLDALIALIKDPPTVVASRPRVVETNLDWDAVQQQALREFDDPQKHN